MVFETIPLSHSGTPPPSHGTGRVHNLIYHFLTNWSIQIKGKSLSREILVGKKKGKLFPRI